MEKHNQVKKSNGSVGCNPQTTVVNAAKIIIYNPSKSGCYIKAVDNSVSTVVNDISLRIGSKFSPK